MSPGKRVDIRPAQRWSTPERTPASHRGRKFWIVRWIGAANRRNTKPVTDVAVDAPSARIIRLTWADTFGRPGHAKALGVFRPTGAVVRLLPL